MVRGRIFRTLYLKVLVKLHKLKLNMYVDGAIDTELGKLFSFFMLSSNVGPYEFLHF